MEGCGKPRRRAVALTGADWHRLYQNSAMSALSPKFAEPAPCVHGAGVRVMHHAQASTQSVVGGRHEEQMHVIRHQAVRQTRYARGGAGFAQQLQVAGVVSVTEEGLLATIPALRDVMGQTWNDDACKAGHAGLRSEGSAWKSP